MKTFTKLFVAVAVLVTGFACTTDATEDLGVVVGGQTEIALSLEESRTQFGEKVDGVYPLYWSEGDKIAVNGVVSEALAASAEGKANALFTLNGNVAYPYNIVCPAADGVSAVASGCQAVVFPATQNYVAGNVDGKAIVMYGYAEEGETPTLKHLTGVLRIAVKGQATLSSLTVTSPSGALAGTFDVNCANGELTAQEGTTSNTVSMSFGEGLALGAEATPIYVAVPAGEYGIVSVTLATTSGEKMLIKFDSSSKPISVGKVREFSEFEFVANVGADDLFVIDSKEALIAFAAAPTKSAVVTTNIDMTGVAWTPIDGFYSTFDGGNFSIKGLSAPLFKNANGVIKNVKLVDVNIASNNSLVLGAVACNLFADADKAGVVEGCSVSGTITINNSILTLASSYDSLYEVAHFGGVVGALHGASIVNCKNEAKIQVDAVAQAANEVVVHAFVGGIVGCSSTITVGESVINSSVKGCENRGAINYHDGATKQVLIPHVGGIVGATTKENHGEISNCSNYGAIDYNSISGMVDTSLGIDGGLTMGGIAGSSYGVMENDNNYGALTISGGKPKAIHLGGVAGSIAPIKFYNNHNHTSGKINVDKSVLSWSINVAGLVAEYVNNATVDDESVDSCSNDGAIEVHASTDPAITIGTYYYRVAGLTCYQNFTICNCENKANGDITVSGDVILARKNDQPCYGVVGAMAYMTTAGNPYNIVNRGDVNVYTNVSIIDGITDETHCRLNIAGVAGYFTRSLMDGASNYGNITIGKPGIAQTIQANGIFIGGISAHETASVDCISTNEGNLTIHDKVTLNSGKNIFVSTMHGYIGKVLGTNNTNKGELVCNGTYTVAGDGTFIGGVAGWVNGASISNTTNEGDVTFGGTTSGSLYLAGVVGETGAACTFTDVSNKGVVTDTKEAKNTGVTYLGGIIGYANKAITLTRVSNSTKQGVKYGIVFSRQSSKTSGSCDLRIGGIVGRVNGLVTTADYVTNSAGLLVNGYQLGSSGISLGGIAGMFNNSAHVLKGLVQNSGEIYYEGRCPKSNFGFAGCIATIGSGATTYENIINTGDIIAKKAYSDSYPTAESKTMQVGGVIASVSASAGAPLSNAKCFCNMTMEGVASVRVINGTSYTNSFGMLMGGMATGVVKNSHCGGSILLEYDIEDEGYKGVSLNAENYFDYISGTQMTADEAKAAGCGYISSINATPIYSTK